MKYYQQVNQFIIINNQIERTHFFLPLIKNIYT